MNRSPGQEIAFLPQGGGRGGADYNVVGCVMILLPRIIAPPGDYWVVNGRGKYGTRRKTASSGKLWHLLVGEINPIQVGCLKYPFIS